MNAKRIAAMLTAVAAAGLAAGCGTTTTGNAPSQPPTSAPAPSAAQPAPKAGIGHMFTVQATHADGSPWYTVQIRLDKMTEPAPPDPEADLGNGTNMAAAPPGHHIAAAEFTWTTTASSDWQGVTPSGMMEFTARGSDGRWYNTSIGVGAGNNIDSQNPDLGQAGTGTVSFVVPDGIRITEVKYTPLGGADHAWFIGQ